MTYDIVGAQTKRIEHLEFFIKNQAELFSKLIDRCEELEEENKRLEEMRPCDY